MRGEKINNRDGIKDKNFIEAALVKEKICHIKFMFIERIIFNKRRVLQLAFHFILPTLFMNDTDGLFTLY